MIPQHLISELNHLLMVCKMIMMTETSDNFEERHKYYMIFSPRICRRVGKISREIDVCFDYYDPDGSYTEDCVAFVNALESYIHKLHQSDRGTITHAEVVKMFEHLQPCES